MDKTRGYRKSKLENRGSVNRNLYGTQSEQHKLWTVFSQSYQWK